MKKAPILFFFLFTILFAYGQDIKVISPTKKLIESLKSKNVVLKQYDLFTVKKQIKRSDPPYKQFLKDSKLISIKENQMKALLSESPDAISISIPGIGTNDFTIELIKVNLFKDGFQVVTDADESVEVDLGVHYRGIISNTDQSLASLSIYENEVMGLFSTQEFGNIVLGKLKESEDLILYAEHNLNRQRDFICATPDDDYIYSEEELTRGLETRDVGDPVGIYIEADKDIFQANGNSETATAQWLSAMFAQAAAIYDIEGVTIQISYMKIWTQKTQHRGGSSGAFLSSFQRKTTNWNGDLAILLNLVNAGGIAAGFNGLCNSNRSASMSYAGIDASYENIPTYSWTVDVFCHELGHLFGSRHTHACVWNSNGTAIDGCYTVEGSCPRPTFRGPGTIMSYCHLSGNNGKDLSQAFHPQPATILLNSIAAASCLGGGTGNHCNNGVMDADEEGVDCGGVDCEPCNSGSCDIPSPTQTNNVRRNRARLNWTSIAGASNYTVRKRVLGTSIWDTHTTSNTNITLGGLTPNTTYEWQVQADCGSSVSTYSNTCTFLTGGSKTQSCGGNSIIVDNNVSIYPNPVSHDLTIELGKFATKKGEMLMFDELGRVIIRKPFENTHTLIVDVSGINTGLHLIKIAGEQELSLHKIMVRK